MLQVDYKKELEDRVIYLQTTRGGFTVILCEKMENGAVNAIPVRMEVFRDFKKALEVAEEWSSS